MISLEKITKQFGERTVIDTLSLVIKQNQIVGFLGPNGAGKTTTLRMIAGVLPQTSGTITIDGDLLAQNPGIKKKIGYLPENNPLYDELTVEEWLLFWAQIKHIPKEKQKDVIKKVVKQIHIEDVFYRPISELSKGYRQRVGLAQAILSEPEILILDEPTEGLDPNQRRDMHQLIDYLSKHHTIIISSHVLSEIEKLANRLIIIHQGKVVADSPANKLKVKSEKSKKETVIIETEMKGKSILSTFRKLKDVVSVEQDDADHFRIHAKKDIRDTLVKLATKEKWSLLSLSKKEQGLEEIFRKLTNE